jgi:hypothetical protein
VLAQAPAAAAQQEEATFAPPVVGSHGYVRRREQGPQQQEQQGPATAGLRTGPGGVGRIRGLEEGAGGDVGFEFLQQYGMAKAPGPLALTPDRKVRTYACIWIMVDGSIDRTVRDERMH